jgi:hypothetical protein
MAAVYRMLLQTHCLLACQDIIYGNKYDGLMKTGVKARKQFNDMFTEYDTFKDTWSDICEKVKKERARRASEGEELEPAPGLEVQDVVLQALDTDLQHVSPMKADPSVFSLKTKEHWLATAARTARQYIKLSTEPSSDAGMLKLVEESPLADIKGKNGKSRVLIVLDTDCLGEHSSRPAYRQVVVDEVRLKKLLCPVLNGRAAAKPAEQNLIPEMGDTYMVLDGGRSAMELMGLAAFRADGAKKTSAPVVRRTIVLSWQSVTARKVRTKANADYKQVQSAYMISAPGFDTPDKAFKNYEGGSCSEAIAGVVLNPLSSRWSMTVADKKILIGPANRQDAGDMADAGKPREDTDVEPVFYHGMPQQFFNNIIAAYSVIGVMDLSAGSGEVAKACLENRIPYHGLCLTDVHESKLADHLTEFLYNCMIEEGHHFYTAGAAAQAKGDKEADAKAKAKAKPQAKPEDKTPKKDGDKKDGDKKDGNKGSKRKRTDKGKAAKKSKKDSSQESESGDSGSESSDSRSC